MAFEGYRGEGPPRPDDYQYEDIPPPPPPPTEEEEERNR